MDSETLSGKWVLPLPSSFPSRVNEKTGEEPWDDALPFPSHESACWVAPDSQRDFPSERTIICADTRHGNIWV